jgi:hypothetical protein
MPTNNQPEVPSLNYSLAVGSIGFSAASLAVFATVALGERWLYSHLGLNGAYIFWTALFILLGGTVLGSLVVTRWRLPKFYFLFGAAFFAYAVGWTASYFILRDPGGEWVGSLLGSFLLTAVLLIGFGRLRLVLKMGLVVFVLNSLGYFLGSAINDFLGGRPGMLLWGVVYGLFLGAGISFVLHSSQVPRSD